jgi:hypothetical protein
MRHTHELYATKSVTLNMGTHAFNEVHHPHRQKGRAPRKTQDERARQTHTHTHTHTHTSDHHHKGRSYTHANCTQRKAWHWICVRMHSAKYITCTDKRTSATPDRKSLPKHLPLHTLKTKCSDWPSDIKTQKTSPAESVFDTQNCVSDMCVSVSDCVSDAQIMFLTVFLTPKSYISSKSYKKLQCFWHVLFVYFSRSFQTISVSDTSFSCTFHVLFKKLVFLTRFLCFWQCFWPFFLCFWPGFWRLVFGDFEIL